MKNIKHILISGILVVTIIACNKNSTMNHNNDASIKENNFSSPEEAVNKGKSDLVSIVKNNKEFNLGLNLADLENSVAGKAVAEGQMNFDRLVQSQQDSLSTLVEDSKRLSTPLMNNRNVVSIIEATKTDKGWQLGELGNKNLASDLNELQKHTNLNEANVSLIEVPNLQAFIYEVTANNQKQYYTKYGGHSLLEPVNQYELLKQLQAEAVRFQREFGDQLKKNNLVK